jgi:hypothetical protein
MAKPQLNARNCLRQLSSIDSYTFLWLSLIMTNIVDRIEVKSGMIYGERPCYYFGYGLESVPEVMDAIAGRSLTAELGVIAVKKQLHIQEIDQVPDKPVAAFGDKSPQQILSEAWQKHTDVPFSSYALRGSVNRSDLVTGTFYELGMNDALRLNKWNLATPFVRNASGQISWPGWRYWDHLIELADGRQVSTLTVYSEQPVDRAAPGSGYNPFLNDQEITMRIIQESVS